MVLDLERSRRAVDPPLEPDHVDERHGVDRGEGGGQGSQAAVAEAARAERPRPVVRGHPDVEAERSAEIPEPRLYLRVGSISVAARLDPSSLPLRVLADAREVGAPGALRRLVALAGRQGYLPLPTSKRSPQRRRGRWRGGWVLGDQSQDAAAHGEVLVPPAELDPRPGERVVPLHDGGVEGRRDRRVQEVEQVRGGRRAP